MTMLTTRIASASMLALFMAMGASNASAQSSAQPPAAQPAPAPAMQAADISEDKLESFADSLGEIMQIREDFTARLEKTGDPAEAQRLQQEANQKMMSTVESNDLSVDEYNAINAAIQTDPELRNRVIAMLQ